MGIILHGHEELTGFLVRMTVRGGGDGKKPRAPQPVRGCEIALAFASDSEEDLSSGLSSLTLSFGRDIDNIDLRQL